MKNKIFIPLLSVLGLAVGLLLLQACKDFLDKKPISDLTTSNFYTTQADALAALTAAYDPMGWDIQTMGEWEMGDVVGGDADKGSTDDQDFAEILNMQRFNTLASNSELNARWNQAYQGIYRCNLVLERVPPITDPKLTDDLKNRILAEAKFLRAGYNFYLVKAFGSVPIITKVLKPDEVYVSRPANIKENWDQMEQDLTEAATALPLSYSGGDVGRATKGAANALLAKCYIFQSTPGSVFFTSPKWQQAADKTAEIINSGVYSLDPTYIKQFTLEGENGPEAVFEIQAVGGTNGWHLDNQGQALNQWISPRTKEFSGWGFDTPIGPKTVDNYGGNAKSKVNNIVEDFEPGDPRLSMEILQEGDTIFGQRYNYEKDANGQYTKYAPWTRSNYSIRKWLIPESQLSGAANSPLNLKMIRYADVLLWNAEANNELGKTTEALTSLNLVRKRAFDLKKATYAPDHTKPAIQVPNPFSLITETDQAKLRDIIIHERRIELAYEGHRFFDLVRTNRAEAFLNAMGRPFKKGKSDLFPIPQAEIDKNKNLQGHQNPGY